MQIMCQNRLQNTRGYGTYIHLIFHQEELSLHDCMLQEHNEHVNTLYCSGKVTPLDLKFFLSPPLDQDSRLVDTRNPVIMSDAQLDALIAKHSHGNDIFDDSVFQGKVDDNGVRFVVHFSGRSESQRVKARALYGDALSYLASEGSGPDEHGIENDDVFDASFSFLFLPRTPSGSNSKMEFFTRVGRAAAYLIMNRDGLDLSVLTGAPQSDIERAGRFRWVHENSEGYAFCGRGPNSTESPVLPIGNTAPRKVSFNYASGAAAAAESAAQNRKALPFVHVFAGKDIGVEDD
jgi:hypothetical protein